MTQPETADTAVPTGVERPADPRRFITVVFVVGVLSIIGVVLLTPLLMQRPAVAVPDTPWVLVLFAVLLAIGELTYVPVRHGDTFEDLTFYEAFLAIAVLVLAPPSVMLVAVAGLAMSELLLKRQPIKAVFNISTYAMATSGLVITYAVIDSGADPVSPLSALALIVGMAVWEFVNLLLWGWLLHRIEGISAWQLVRSQVWLSTLMALSSAGVAITFVALFRVSPILSLLAFLPSLYLRWAFQANRDRLAGIDQASKIAAFPALLTPDQPPLVQASRATTALRSLAGSDVAVLTADGLSIVANMGDAVAESRPATPGEMALLGEIDGTAERIQRLDPAQLPPGWRTGYAIPLTLPTSMGGRGILTLGATRAPRGIERFLPWTTGGRDHWELRENSELRPLLTSLVSALTGALQASAGVMALQEETAKLSAVVDNATDGIAVFDTGQRVLLWSPAMVRITGVTPGSPEADAPSAIAIVDALGAVAAGAPAAPDGGADPAHATDGETQVTITRADGEVRDLDVAVVELADEAGLAVLTVRDMTRQRRLDRMKQDFIATVSHELKTPITPIKGYAQLLGANWDKLTPEKRARILSTIEERANHLSRLVDDLLMASRASEVDSAKLDVRLQSISLAELVKREVEGQTALASRISMSGSDALVVADIDRARQCLANLIGNAGKYSRADSPILVEFGPLEGERWAAVDVIDQGSGIPADEQDRVFDKFYRVEDPMTMTTGGNGLGLFISRQLARAMGGDITVESTVGVGSRFRMTLPLEEAQP